MARCGIVLIWQDEGGCRTGRNDGSRGPGASNRGVTQQSLTFTA